MWNEGQGVPALIVARAVAPTAYSTGVSFTTAAGYLLTVPGLPANVATALRGLSGDGTTLPLPVNSQYLRATTADVNGSTATVLTSRDEVISAVVWVRGGQVTAVAGSLARGGASTNENARKGAANTDGLMASAPTVPAKVEGGAHRVHGPRLIPDRDPSIRPRFRPAKNSGDA